MTNVCSRGLVMLLVPAALAALACSRQPRPTRPPTSHPARALPAEAVVTPVPRPVPDPVWGPFIELHLTRFRGGEEHIDPMPTFGAAPNDAALALIADALAAERDPEVRQRHVRLLVAIGAAIDPAAAQGGDALRDPRIIALLFAGLADPSPEVTWSYIHPLLIGVPTELMARHRHKVLARLRRKPPDEWVLRLVARTRPPGALPLVEAIMAHKDWQDSDGGRAALAALGRSDVEKQLIDAFLASRGPDEMARLSTPLGLIATPKALGALCSQMRSPWITGFAGSERNSVRVFLVAGLRRAFPTEPVLWNAAFTNDAAIAAAEAFCEAHFQTRWTTPRPPFMWTQARP